MCAHVHINGMTCMLLYKYTNAMATVQVELSLSLCLPFKHWILSAFTALAKQLPTPIQTFFHSQSHSSSSEHAHTDPAPTVPRTQLSNPTHFTTAGETLCR